MNLIILIGIGIGLFLFVVNLIIYVIRRIVYKRWVEKDVDREIETLENAKDLKPETREILRSFLIAARLQRRR